MFILTNNMLSDCNCISIPKVSFRICNFITCNTNCKKNLRMICIDSSNSLNKYRYEIENDRITYMYFLLQRFVIIEYSEDKKQQHQKQIWGNIHDFLGCTICRFAFFNKWKWKFFISIQKWVVLLVCAEHLHVSFLKFIPVFYFQYHHLNLITKARIIFFSLSRSLHTLYL